MWYPVNGGVTPTLHFPGDENGKMLTIPESPDAAQELSDWSEDSLQLSVQAAVNLGFNVASVDVKGSHKVIVVQAIRYADHPAPNGVTIRYGAGIELKVDAWAENGDVKATLPMVAAQVTLNVASSSVSLSARGFSDTGLATLSDDLPALASMDVGRYAELVKALDNCRAKILKMSESDLKPEIFAVNGPPPAQPENVHHWPRLHL